MNTLIHLVVNILRKEERDFLDKKENTNHNEWYNNHNHAYNLTIKQKWFFLTLKKENRFRVSSSHKHDILAKMMK